MPSVSIGDAVTILILILAAALAMFFIRKGKKSGGCGGNCSHCAGCAPQETQPEETGCALPGEHPPAPPQNGFVKPYGDLQPPERQGPSEQNNPPR